MAKRLHSSSMTAAFFRKEALIHSLSAFILEFLGNARNGMTQIASYLRSPMTRQCIKIFMKADSMSGSVLPKGGKTMKKLLKAVLTGSLLGLSILGFAGCGGGQSGSSSGGGSVPKDTIVVGMSVDPETLDPAVTMDNKGWQITYPAYERLVKYKVVDGKATTEVEPSLAKSWTVSDDGLTWTFTLNEGHKFADGSPVDAKAVKFSIERVQKMKKGPSDYFKVVKSIDTPDDKTVIFQLDKPFAPFLYTLAVNGSSIVNPKVMDQAKDNDMGSSYLATHTMGSGAYEITSYTPQPVHQAGCAEELLRQSAVHQAYPFQQHQGSFCSASAAGKG